MIAGIVTGWVLFIVTHIKKNEICKVGSALQCTQVDKHYRASLFVALFSTFVLPPLGFFNGIPYGYVKNLQTSLESIDVSG
jgi:hypothetical protein